MILKAVVVAFLALLTYFVASIVKDLGFHLYFYRHYPGSCRRVKGLNYGSEDFQVLGNGLTFITSGFAFPASPPSYLEFLKTNDVGGRIFVLDMSKPQIEAREVSIKPSQSFNPTNFRPHGISVLEDKVNGEHLLYVVNHPENEEADRVEKFRYLPKSNSLEHAGYFTSDLLRITNDLAVTGEDTFYISNYLYFRTAFGNMVEHIMGLPKFGSLIYYNGTGFKTVSHALIGPNGVTLSSDGRHVYVAFPIVKKIQVLERQIDNELKLVQELDVHTRPDNFHLSQDGKSLYTGAHPIGYLVMQHLENPTLSAYSQVLRLPLKMNGQIDQAEITEEFLDDGRLISGSSVAAVYGHRMLIGSVINKLVLCDLDK